MKRTLLAVVISALVSCEAAPVGPVASETGAPSMSPTARAESTPTVTPAFSVSPLPSPSAIAQATGVRTNALGRLTGNWLFVGKQVPGAHNIRAEVQIWAVPLDGGLARFAFGYEVPLGGVPEAIFDDTPYLRRQFSPDGTRVVVSVDRQLVVVDLVSGRTSALGVSGYFPSWSKDGSRIAFLFETPIGNVVPPEDAMGTIPAGGGPVRQIAVVGYARHSVEWSPDGSMFVIAQPNGIAIVEAATGQVIRRIAEISEAGSSFAHWRTKTPQVAITVTGCEQATTRVIALDNSMSAPRKLLDTGERCAPLNLRDPRWNPVGDELLYVSARAAPGVQLSEYRAHVIDVASGRDTVLPLLAWEATWTWDGTQIAYIARSLESSYGNAVSLWRRDGSGGQELLRAGGSDLFFSLASLSY
jgi:WD40 repeat protein